MSNLPADLALSPVPVEWRIRLPVRTQPEARREGVIGIHAGAFRIAATAHDADEKANAAPFPLLAAALDSRRADSILEAGFASRRERVLVADPDAGFVRERLASALVATVPESLDPR